MSANARVGRRAEQKRRWDRANQHRPCPHCRSQRDRSAKICRGCFEATVMVRYSLIEGLWADGWTLAEIAETLGTTVNALGARMHEMRLAGWRLPFRLPRRSTPLQAPPTPRQPWEARAAA